MGLRVFAAGTVFIGVELVSAGFGWVSIQAEQADFGKAVDLHGTNRWVLGWNFDEYRDRQAVEVVGPRDGWVAIR